jgi:hypothetical protein
MLMTASSPIRAVGYLASRFDATDRVRGLRPRVNAVIGNAMLNGPSPKTSNALTRRHA